jgi:hypothetical protein
VPLPYRPPTRPHSPRRPRARRRAARAAALGSLAVLAALALSACGANTLQDRPVAPAAIERMILQDQMPVYWLGGSFHGLAITNVKRDPGGAFQIQYGNCSEGGEGVCVTPLQVVTSPDNSFVPGGSIAKRTVSIRGVRATVVAGGDTVEVPTAGVVVDIDADNPRLAGAAAQTMATVDGAYLPGAPLPRPLPNTGYPTAPASAQ